MGGGGVMRAAAKVAGVGVVNTTFRTGFQVAPSSTEHSIMRVASRPASSAMVASGGGATADVAAAKANQKASWEIVDDWEFAGSVEDEVVATAVSGGGEPIARVLFDGVPTVEEAKEATADLKEALDKVYLSSSNSAKGVSGLSSLSYPEETKDCVACDVTSVPKPAIQAFKLLNESPAVQGVVASLAADPNVWNAVVNNPAYMEYIQCHKTTREYEAYGDSPRSSESSVKLEEYLDAANQPRDGAHSISDFLQNVKTTVVEMVNKATDFFQSLFVSPSDENAKDNAGTSSSFFDKTVGASLMGLAVMVVMVVLMKRA